MGLLRAADPLKQYSALMGADDLHAAPHPWVAAHVAAPEELATLADAARSCLSIREIANPMLREEHQPLWLPSSPAADLVSSLAVEEGRDGQWGTATAQELVGLLAHHCRMHLSYATNLVAAVAALVHGGEYLFGIAPLTRSSLEASTTVRWLLDDKMVNSRERTARVYLERLVSIRRQVAATDKKSEAGEQVRGLVKKIEARLGDLFFEAEVEKGSTGWESIDSSICRQQIPGLESRVALFGQWYGDQGDAFRKFYGMIAVGSHPNPSFIETLVRRESVFVDVEGLRYIIALAVVVLANALNHSHELFGWGDANTSEMLENLCGEFQYELRASP